MSKWNDVLNLIGLGKKEPESWLPKSSIPDKPAPPKNRDVTGGFIPKKKSISNRKLSHEMPKAINPRIKRKLKEAKGTALGRQIRTGAMAGMFDDEVQDEIIDTVAELVENKDK